VSLRAHPLQRKGTQPRGVPFFSSAGRLSRSFRCSVLYRPGSRKLNRRLIRSRRLGATSTIKMRRPAPGLGLNYGAAWKHCNQVTCS